MSLPGVQSGNQAMEPTLASLQKNLNDLSTKVRTKIDDSHTDIASMKKKMQDLDATVKDNSASMLDVENKKLPGHETKLMKEIDELKDIIVGWAIPWVPWVPLFFQCYPREYVHRTRAHGRLNTQPNGWADTDIGMDSEGRHIESCISVWNTCLLKLSSYTWISLAVLGFLVLSEYYQGER